MLLYDTSGGEYQLYQFPIKLPLNDVRWVHLPGRRGLTGNDALGTIYEWYGESGGQLKYYPQVGYLIVLN